MTSMQSIWQCMSPVKACWNGAHERTASVMATGGIVWQVRAASWSAVAIAGVLIPNASAAIIAPEKIRDYLRGPMGRGAEIVAVWIILPGDNAPRFVTAYPKD